uniref:Peptidase metallopeptidase domain-containing protein n=1 Tax=Cyclopterus lumpus TaxID=8103 RepID=A0A8C2ZIN3_CYCLU
MSIFCIYSYLSVDCSNAPFAYGLNDLFQEYLRHFYGYKPESERQKRTADSDVNADWPTGLCDEVQRMQRFFGLPPTGELTNDTLAVMRRPRCGLSDVEPFGGTIRWKKHSLSYRIAGYNLPVLTSKVHNIFRAAWKIWSNVTPMKFRKRGRKEADIVISFHTGDHEDGSPFDGTGGILAHAFLPGLGIGGDVHFDADEDWSYNSTGFNLFAVAVHEFGHALGLSHSSDPGAIMYPAYNVAPSYEIQLSFKDVKDIQRLYGISSNFASLSSKNPPPRTPDKCDPDLSFDAVTELQQEVLNVEKNVNLFFKGHQYWVLRQLRLEEGLPRNISDFGFPSGIKYVDAALHFRNERYTVFFTGHECWRYNEQQMMMEGSATLIEQQWPGIPTPIDAAVFSEGSYISFRCPFHFHERYCTLNNMLEG